MDTHYHGGTMDPDATLECLADALREGNYTQAERLRDALNDWLRRGGFPPDWHSDAGGYVVDHWHLIDGTVTT